ncbi:hypothetical protein [Bilifractor porci]|uniref:Uncharacterized protein n=1 Tax=Bilifractor porci TaxID=2606636 RepID=A0A7X2TPD1_9FIRM|nr:hypothetical protein [Bilifractor porci]MST82480.1 hypothetical protein [Bilifractor porci]
MTAQKPRHAPKQPNTANRSKTYEGKLQMSPETASAANQLRTKNIPVKSGCFLFGQCLLFYGFGTNSQEVFGKSSKSCEIPENSRLFYFSGCV